MISTVSSTEHVGILQSYLKVELQVVCGGVGV